MAAAAAPKLAGVGNWGGYVGAVAVLEKVGVGSTGMEAFRRLRGQQQIRGRRVGDPLGWKYLMNVSMLKITE